uniref:Gsp_06 putative toxin n=1 Tax=Gemmula speciosa TaxID=439592 RepID=A0A098LWA2_GEMSP
MAFSLDILMCIAMVVAMTTIINGQGNNLPQCRHGEICGMLTNSRSQDHYCQCSHGACPIMAWEYEINNFFFCKIISSIRACETKDDDPAFRHKPNYILSVKLRCRCAEYDWYNPSSKGHIYCSELDDK